MKEHTLLQRTTAIHHCDTPLQHTTVNLYTLQDAKMKGCRRPIVDTWDMKEHTLLHRSDDQ